MRVAVNCEIATRGFSGSATGMWHLVRALESLEGIEVDLLWPQARRRSSSLLNGGAQMTWDMRGAARAASDAGVLVSPCNVGRARRGQGHMLVLHDTRVLDEPQPGEELFARYARVLFRLSARGAEALLVPSAHTAARVRDRWPGLEPIVAQFPVTVSSREAAGRSVPRTVLMVGETARHKRHLLAVDAVARARALSGEDIRLTIAGPSGNAEADVAAVITRITADWITRIHDLPHEALAEQYRSAWVLLHPSRREGFGLPVAEAAGAGVPTVHSGYEALSEVAPGAVGDPDGAESYADALVALLDDGAYERAVAAGYEAARCLSRDAYVAVVRAALARCVA
jgi:glycosyltransferase involved in cell wall biosynthesis